MKTTQKREEGEEQKKKEEKFKRLPEDFRWKCSSEKFSSQQVLQGKCRKAKALKASERLVAPFGLSRRKVLRRAEGSAASSQLQLLVTLCSFVGGGKGRTDPTTKHRNEED